MQNDDGRLRRLERHGVLFQVAARVRSAVDDRSVYGVELLAGHGGFSVKRAGKGGEIAASGWPPGPKRVRKG